MLRKERKEKPVGDAESQVSEGILNGWARGSSFQISVFSSVMDWIWDMTRQLFQIQTPGSVKKLQEIQYFEHYRTSSNHLFEFFRSSRCRLTEGSKLMRILYSEVLPATRHEAKSLRCRQPEKRWCIDHPRLKTLANFITALQSYSCSCWNKW